MTNELPESDLGDKWWLVLVTFENNGDLLDMLTPAYHGAVSWMAAIAKDENELIQRLQASLSEVGYKLVECDDLKVVDSMMEIEETDEHLAANIKELEPGKSVVWGTIHRYLADGET